MKTNKNTSVRVWQIVAYIALLCVMSVTCFVTFACTKDNDNKDNEQNQNQNTNVPSPCLSGAAVTEDAKFHAANVDCSAEAFNALGFALGDSCNVVFSNGYELRDVPYFNGYYVKNGAPVIVAYPSNKYILITLNNNGIWSDANLSDGCTVTITLNTSAKYLDTQNALGQSYSLVRDEYTSDAEFANFRAVVGGNLKENSIYRGASPVDNSRNRAAYADALLKENGIKYVVDLADSEDEMLSYFQAEGFASDYTKSLYENGAVILLSMSSSYNSDAYKQSVVKGLEGMLDNDGPYYIHCMEGKDRTGFVCALIAALAGASYDEMCSDYMLTYQNYYKITKETTPGKYNAVVALYFDSFMECLYGSSDVNVLKTANYVDSAKKYLKDGGMSDENINKLITLISK